MQLKIATNAEALGSFIHFFQQNKILCMLKYSGKIIEHKNIELVKKKKKTLNCNKLKHKKFYGMDKTNTNLPEF